MSNYQSGVATDIMIIHFHQAKTDKFSDESGALNMVTWHAAPRSETLQTFTPQTSS